MAFLDRPCWIGDQNAQLVARMRQQQAGARLLDAAVVIQSRFEIRGEHADATLCLLQHGQCMLANLDGFAETLQWGALA